MNKKKKKKKLLENFLKTKKQIFVKRKGNKYLKGT